MIVIQHLIQYYTQFVRLQLFFAFAVHHLCVDERSGMLRWLTPGTANHNSIDRACNQIYLCIVKHFRTQLLKLIKPKS